LDPNCSYLANATHGWTNALFEAQVAQWTANSTVTTAYYTPPTEVGVFGILAGGAFATVTFDFEGYWTASTQTVGTSGLMSTVVPGIPYSVSAYIPFVKGYGGYTYTYTHLAAQGQPTFNCSSHSATVSTFAAKAALSGGPLTLFGRSTNSAANVISGPGWNFSLQPLPWLGYQVNINSSGVVGGFTFGVPGASFSYGWGSCTAE
jgi:hypothetical protein